MRNAWTGVRWVACAVTLLAVVSCSGGSGGDAATGDNGNADGTNQPSGFTVLPAASNQPNTVWWCCRPRSIP